MLYPDATAPGANGTPSQEVVRFRSAAAFAFAATDVAEVARGPRLFTMSSAAQDDLDRQIIPAELGQGLAAQRIRFAADQAKVKRSAPDQCWKIRDAHHRHTFVVEKQPQGLNVYDGHQTSMQVNFLGLAGVLGPLPTPHTKVLLERLCDGDTILRDFLDIFNHRLVSLLYQVRKRHRAGFEPQAAGEDRFARTLFSLIGLGHKEMRNRLSIPDRALLPYAGLLAGEVRSAIGLERLLADYFGAAVQVKQFGGEWVQLDAAQWTVLGDSGRNQRLGAGFLMGQCIYDVQGQVEVQLGPLSLREFLDFLPNGRGYRTLGELVRFYGRDEFAVELQLRLMAAEVPKLRLGTGDGSRLGWTTWLKPTEAQEDAGLVRLKILRRNFKCLMMIGVHTTVTTY